MKFHPSIVTSTFVSPLGPMTLAATDAGLAGVWFEDQRYFNNPSGRRCLKFRRVKPPVTATSAGRLATRRRCVLWGQPWGATR